jgi:hypothetical protein
MLTYFLDENHTPNLNVSLVITFKQMIKDFYNVAYTARQWRDKHLLA